MARNIFDGWEAIREKGKFRFFFVNGVISYGLPMFVVMAFIVDPFNDGFISKAAIVHYILWPMAGLFMAYLCGTTVSINTKKSSNGILKTIG